MKQQILNMFLISICFSVFGQYDFESNMSMRDSLIEELKTARVDSLKAEIYIRLAENFEYSNSDSTYYYADKALQLSKNTQNIPAQMGAMSFISYALFRQGNLPRALEISLEATRLGKNLPVRIAGGIGPVYSVLGELYLELGDYEKAKYYFFKMAALGEDDIVGVAYGQFYLANIYEALNKLDSANFYLEQSYQTFGTLHYSNYPNIYNVYPPWYNVRAKVYLKQNKPNLALNDLFTSLQMTVRNEDIFHISNTCIDISNFYERYNQPDSALFYAEMGIREATRINYMKAILSASENLARLYEIKNPVKAVHFYKLASETRNKLYGAGNIQIMKDMIAQNEKTKTEIDSAKAKYQNQLRMNAILGVAFTLFVIAIFLFINSRRKQKAKQKIEKAYVVLKATQTQLIHSEKMASLGELTAGIAHEIQNPLNFVNNFSEVSVDMIAELSEEMKEGNQDEVKIITSDLKQNLEKIHHHGTRASSIVKGMLEHSRSGSNEKHPTDINAMADEYIRLAYHGMRAKDNLFQADFKVELDEKLPKLNVVGQDIARVVLNLINNAFQACAERSRSEEKKGERGYKPLVVISTHLLNNHVEIRIKDNGNGIPQEIKGKIFQPFFTTKPAGKGTGLGLSLSYDIITKGHAGELKVNSKEGEGTEFIIVLPI